MHTQFVLRSKKQCKQVKARIALAIGFFIIIGAIYGYLPDRQNGREQGPITQVIIRRGDTLWQIADQYGNPQKDLRRIVYEIEQINNLGTNMIYPGQKILVPVQ